MKVKIFNFENLMFVFSYQGPTTISLYQILYEEKESKTGYGHFYKVYH